jgi:16S rRNA C967 or C1407 C5-methylase (RsmB/RsmF family)
LNEFSRERRARLKAVLYDHLPAEVVSDRCQVTGHDGQRWGLFEQKSYDAVLVDAPCSGERHLLKTPRELGQWKLSRSKILQVRQHALLCAALEAVKPGGVVVYSTCSLSSVENDGVIAKLQKSRAERFELLPLVGEANSVGEPTEFGRIFLPDRGAGMGPMYVARLRAL